jgi:hypothetical protein
VPSGTKWIFLHGLKNFIRCNPLFAKGDIAGFCTSADFTATPSIYQNLGIGLEKFYFGKILSNLIIRNSTSAERK